MNGITRVLERRTNADDVFDSLYQEIVTLALMPGTKMSEVEIATRFGVSRQPVRDAFSRLGRLGFLNIRPQRATEVALFSRTAIDAARFVRLSLEVEVVRRCLENWSDAWRAIFARNLDAQRAAMAASDKLSFLDQDFAFHRMLLEAAGVPFASESLRENKVQVDRLCLLSLNKGTAIDTLIADHEAIVAGFDEATSDTAVAAMRMHLRRLDRTVDAVQSEHAPFFEA